MSVWCLAGKEKTRFAWDWGRERERVANRLKKNAMKTGFSGSGIYDRESGFQSNTGARFQIESMHGKRVPKILHRLRQKKKIQLWGDIKDFENFPTEVKKILRRKARWPLLLVQHVQFSKLKYSYNLNGRVFLFSAKTYQILWTRCLLLSMVCN